MTNNALSAMSPADWQAVGFLALVLAAVFFIGFLCVLGSMFADWRLSRRLRPYRRAFDIDYRCNRAVAAAIGVDPHTAYLALIGRSVR